MKLFEALGVNEAICTGLKEMGIQEPTPIQEAVIEKAIEGLDIVGESVTGSGKTLAYLVPLLQKIDGTKRENQAIILAPTHELAAQITGVIKTLSDAGGLGIKSLMLIGETSLKRQVESLKDKPHVLVGSPGRISELIQMKKLKAHTVKTIVFDEADRLLDDSKMKDCQSIIKATLRDRQLLAFSASITPTALEQLTGLMKTPHIAKISGSAINPNIDHYYVIVDPRDKIDAVRRISSALEEERLLVFLNKNQHIQDMDTRLKHHKVQVCAIYGTSERDERKDSIQGFRSGRYKVMIASDLAARGLDIQNLNVVVNADLPRDSDEYLHRVGRTARHQNKGVAILLLSTSEVSFLKKLEKNLNVSFSEMEIQKGKLVVL